MERERIYRESEMIQKKIQSSSPFWVSSSSSPSILGSDHVVHFTATRVQPTPDVHFFRANDGGDDTGSDDFDGGSHDQPKKKRRLTVEQVQYLERSFEKENKLDPERKVELAKELGLQPRQVAIWFQNRRARYKTKRLEKDYDSLKASFDRLKLDFNSLAQEKENLQNVVTMLKNKLKEREKEKDGLNPEPNVPIDSDLQNRPDNAKLGPETIPKSTMASKPDPEANSAKSDVIDSENPHYIDANHNSLSLEPANSSHTFEPELSDEEDHRDLARSILLPTTTTVTTTTMGCILPKLEEGCYPDPSWNVCNLGNGDQDQHFWSWLC